MDGDARVAQTLPFAGGASGGKPAEARSQPDDPTVMPFKSASDSPVLEPPVEVAPVVAAPDNPFEGTVAIDASQVPEPERSPFAMAPAGSRAPGSGRGEGIPGAPWANPGSKVAAAEQVARPALAEPAMVVANPPAAPADEGDVSRAAEQQAQQEAQQQAKQEAEQQAKLALEKQVAAEDEQRAALEAEQQAAAEAEERRRAAIESFRKEQDEARAEQERRAAERAVAKRQAAKTLRQDMYGAFKRKKD